MRAGRATPSGAPGQQRADPELLGRQVLGPHPVPGARGERAAVGERYGAAAGEPFMAAVDHVAGYPGPDQADDRAVAVVGVDAGTADLDQPGADSGQRSEVELALRVEPSGDRGALGRQQPVGADDLAGLRVADQQVVAVGVEGVDVEAGLRGVQEGAHLPGEDVVAQPLCGPDIGLVLGQGDGVAGGGDGLGRVVEGGNAGHGTLLVTGRFGGGGTPCSNGVEARGRPAGSERSARSCSSDAGWRARDQCQEGGCEDAECQGWPRKRETGPGLSTTPGPARPHRTANDSRA